MRMEDDSPEGKIRKRGSHLNIRQLSKQQPACPFSLSSLFHRLQLLLDMTQFTPNSIEHTNVHIGMSTTYDPIRNAQTRQGLRAAQLFLPQILMPSIKQDQRRGYLRRGNRNEKEISQWACKTLVWCGLPALLAIKPPSYRNADQTGRKGSSSGNWWVLGRMSPSCPCQSVFVP